MFYCLLMLVFTCLKQQTATDHHSPHCYTCTRESAEHIYIIFSLCRLTTLRHGEEVQMSTSLPPLGEMPVLGVPSTTHPLFHKHMGTGDAAGLPRPPPQTSPCPPSVLYGILACLHDTTPEGVQYYRDMLLAVSKPDTPSPPCFQGWRWSGCLGWGNLSQDRDSDRTGPNIMGYPLPRRDLGPETRG